MRDPVILPGPIGAAGCSHGWSDAALIVAEPVVNGMGAWAVASRCGRLRYLRYSFGSRPSVVRLSGSAPALMRRSAISVSLFQ